MKFSLTIMLIVLNTLPSLAQVIRMDQRVTERVIIDGLDTDASYVLTNQNVMQTFTCPSPSQAYSKVDGKSKGWACYNQSMGIWLLNATPPVVEIKKPQPAGRLVKAIILAGGIAASTVIYARGKR